MKRAFTLIELLVVIAIIAILAAILFPVFAQAKAAAKTSATISNVKQVMTGVLMYAGDSDDMTVRLDNNNDPQDGQPGHRDFAMQRLFPYTKNSSIFYDATTGESGLPHSMSGVAGDPTYWGDWTQWHNISFNAWGLFGNLNPNTGIYDVARNLSGQDELAERAAIVTVSDPSSGDPFGNYSFLNYYAFQPNYDTLRGDGVFWNNLVYNAAKRHRDGVVTGYADGHAGRKAIKKICLPKGGNWGVFYNDDANGNAVKNYWGYWYSATE